MAYHTHALAKNSETPHWGKANMMQRETHHLDFKKRCCIYLRTVGGKNGDDPTWGEDAEAGSHGLESLRTSYPAWWLLPVLCGITTTMSRQKSSAEASQTLDRPA